MLVGMIEWMCGEVCEEIGGVLRDGCFEVLLLIWNGAV